MATGNMQKIVKISGVVFELCKQTD